MSIVVRDYGENANLWAPIVHPMLTHGAVSVQVASLGEVDACGQTGRHLWLT